MEDTFIQHTGSFGKYPLVKKSNYLQTYNCPVSGKVKKSVQECMSLKF